MLKINVKSNSKYEFEPELMGLLAVARIFTAIFMVLAAIDIIASCVLLFNGSGNIITIRMMIIAIAYLPFGKFILDYLPDRRIDRHKQEKYLKKI